MYKLTTIKEILDTNLVFTYDFTKWLGRLEDGQCDIEDFAEYFNIPVILTKWYAKESGIKYYVRGEGREF